MRFVRGDDALHERMPYDIGFGKFDNGDAFHLLERPVSLKQAGLFVLWQIDLCFVSGNHRFGTVAETGEEHQHLLHG